VIVGQGKSLMITVLATCGLLAIALVLLIGLAVQGRVERYMDERRVLQALAGDGAASAAIADRRQPMPEGSPGRWFSPDSYPLAALRAGEEGRVRVRVAIDSNGSPIGCRVAQSSGHPALDNGTCGVVMAQGHFVPVTNRAGQALAAIWESPRIFWKLEN
jgi:TonB family protein